MEKLEPRVAVLENTISTLLQDVNQNIASGFKKLSDDLSIIREDVKVMRGDIKVLRRDMDVMRRDIATLKVCTAAGFETIEIKFSELIIEISKINDVTSYKGVYENKKK